MLTLQYSAFAPKSSVGPHLGVIVNEHTPTAADIRRHVDALGRHLEFIHHDELLDRLAHPRQRAFCLLTFDDGKRIGYSDAAPQLERLGVPAVFYVPTRFLSGRFALWFDRYEALLKRIGTAPHGLESDIVKWLPLDVLSERLDRACSRHGIALDLEDDTIGPMSWDQAGELSRRGFTIGAHGLRHAVLTSEPESIALSEIQDSIQDVTLRTGVQCPSFAFPNGNYTARLARHALARGVRTVMTTEPVWVDSHSAPWRLPRVQLFPDDGSLRTSAKLFAAKRLLLTNPDGTGHLYRKIRRLEFKAAKRPPAVHQGQSASERTS